MLAFAQMAALTYDFNTGITPRKVDLSTEKKEAPVPKGHKTFYLDGIEIIALNQKNAIKKFQKKYLYTPTVDIIVE